MNAITILKEAKAVYPNEDELIQQYLALKQEWPGHYEGDNAFTLFKNDIKACVDYDNSNN